MTRDTSSFAVFIVGTGRSGTSLTTQTLDKLGLMMPDDQVPPDENNLRGTGESIAVRDQTVALLERLGSPEAFLPSGWQSSPASQKASTWIEEYLTCQRDKAEDHGFVIKFPLASIFLPLWSAAAARIGLDLRFVWATRNPADTRLSLMRTYNQSESTATLRMAQRCFYILRDAPSDTLLLPYEGWTHAPQAQAAALAALAGVTDPKLLENATTFSTMLKRTTADNTTALPPALTHLYKIIHAKCGRLDKILPVGTTAYDRLCVEMADLVEDVHPQKLPLHPLDAMNARLSLISKLAGASDTETTQMKEEIEILTQRIREVNAKNTQLKRSIDAQADAVPAAQTPASRALVAERDRLAQERAAQDIEIQSLKSAYAVLTHEKDALEEDISARSYNTVRALKHTEARQRRNLENLQKRLDKTSDQLKAAESGVAKLTSRLEDMTKRCDALLSSTSWKLTRPIRRIINFVRKKR